MAIGPGRYDDLCTEVCEQLEAEGVVLVVVGGAKGNGISVRVSADALVWLPKMLEDLARSLREDGARVGPRPS